MAKNNQTDKEAVAQTTEGKKQYSMADKVKYFKGRVDDARLSDGQRRYAAAKLAELTSGNSGSGNNNQSQANNRGNNNWGGKVYTVIVKGGK